MYSHFASKAASRRVKYLAVVLVLGMLPFGAASAQVFVSGGLGIPLGPDQVTELYGTGLGAGAGFFLEHTAYPYARLRPQGVYQKFAIDPDELQAFEEQIEDSLGAQVSLSGGDMGIIFAGADLQLRIPNARFTPYVAPALGVSYIAVDDITIEGAGGTTTFDVQNEETAFTLGLGAGLAASLSDRYELFLEAHYMYAIIADGDNQSWVPVRFGLALQLTDY